MSARPVADLLARARAGEPVWLPELRESFGREPDSARIVLRLTGLDGAPRDYICRVPPWDGEEERAFVRDYLCACVFNLLAALSGRGLCFYYPAENRALGGLLGELDGLFQLDRRPRTGCGKAVSVAERLGAAFGAGRFSFSRRDLREWTPLPEAAEPSPEAPLGEKLRAAAARAEARCCCGLDVGGTDIKLAVSENGRLLYTREYDWDPSSARTAEEILTPILALTREAAASVGAKGGFDAIGLSFPDVVIRGRILGGETPKTRGLRESAADYEAEFRKLGLLGERLRACCRPGGAVRSTNDGHMAAFAYAVELACSGRDEELAKGVLAHTLGTDLGTGWLAPDGQIPELPLEMYDLLVDLGSYPQRRYEPADLRSTLNENSGLPGARRYLGQAACYRLAWELDPALLKGFAVREGGRLVIPSAQRKPCLEHLMRLAAQGEPGAEEIFRRIGRHLAELSLEMAGILRPETDLRCLFGRFVKQERVFALIREGCAARMPALRLTAADEALAASPLMRDLAARTDLSVAQFGQAVGAIYYALTEEQA